MNMTDGVTPLDDQLSCRPLAAVYHALTLPREIKYVCQKHHVLYRLLICRDCRPEALSDGINWGSRTPKS